MGLNLSNRQIAQELGLNKDDVQHMTTHLRQGLVDQQEPACLEGAVECDEVYLVAGHKGHPAAVKKKDEKDDASTQRPSGTGHLSWGKTADLRYDSTRGDVCIQMLENVQQKTIEPLIKKAIAPDTLIYTDEYNIYGRLEAWGYAHAVVHHGQGEFARDDDQDGFGEVHVNTMEGFCPYYALG